MSPVTIPVTNHGAVVLSSFTGSACHWNFCGIAFEPKTEPVKTCD